MASNGGRTGATWNAARRHIITTQTHCALCGKPVNRALSGLHPLGPTIDHTPALAAVGLNHHQHFAIYGLDGLTLAHRRCNLSKGTTDGQSHDRDRQPGRSPTRTSRNW